MTTTQLNKNVEEFETTTLTEDGFGIYWDEHGVSHEVKRFTWNNRNKIQVQVISYGARIISMKVPDRKGVIEDIVLGFDDLAGYIYYQPYYLGATIGRTTEFIRHGTFMLNKEEYLLSLNHGKHHSNGGFHGFDQAVWDTHVTGKQVIMSHISSHLSEGYPGDVFVRIIFELSDMNEFKIEMEAFSTKPTIINLSNLTHVNLAGHQTGPDEIYKHNVTINADCYLKQYDDVPTDAVCNVANLPFDFQVPKLLGKIMGVCSGDGFRQHLCINKGMHQDNCFIGRIIHNPTGRVLEVYSNQRCVCFSTANEFGYGRILSMQQLNVKKTDPSTSRIDQKNSHNGDPYLDFLNDIHNKLKEDLKVDKENNYEHLRLLLKKMGNIVIKIDTPLNTPLEIQNLESSTILDLVLTPRQKAYLKGLYDATVEQEGELATRLKGTVGKLLQFGITEMNPSVSVTSSTHLSQHGTLSIPIKKQKEPITKNKIPPHYKKQTQIIGKNRTIYRMHSGIALQTLNYPYNLNLKNHSKYVLNPGENYKHSITYKFWIRSGNPNLWIKKNKHEMEKNL